MSIYDTIEMFFFLYWRYFMADVEIGLKSQLITKIASVWKISWLDAFWLYNINDKRKYKNRVDRIYEEEVNEEWKKVKNIFFSLARRFIVSFGMKREWNLATCISTDVCSVLFCWLIQRLFESYLYRLNF